MTANVNHKPNQNNKKRKDGIRDENIFPYVRLVIEMKKALVAYFSASGVTKKAAEALAKAAGADLFEIQPSVPYTSADLDWTDRQSRSTLEMKDPASRPAIANKADNMDAYDTVFIGFPIWWYVCHLRRQRNGKDR